MTIGDRWETTNFEIPSCSTTTKPKLLLDIQTIRNYVYRFEDLQVQSLDVRGSTGTLRTK
jgi:hypothetical protein